MYCRLKQTAEQVKPFKTPLIPPHPSRIRFTGLAKGGPRSLTLSVGISPPAYLEMLGYHGQVSTYSEHSILLSSVFFNMLYHKTLPL